jgi:histidinol-phosphate aminotransferase
MVISTDSDSDSDDDSDDDDGTTWRTIPVSDNNPDQAQGETGGRTGGPRLSANLRGIPLYKPGKPARGVDGRPAYKLSSNENPYPPLPGVLEAAVAAAGNLNRYPDLGCTGLIAELAARFGVPEAHLATGTGSVGVAQSLIQATAGPGDEVVYAWRSFEAYPIVVQITGATSVQVPLTADGGHDLDAMLAAVTERTRVVIVCNPNNPTGTVVRRAELLRFLDAVPGDVLVVLDEAYTEFVRDPEVPDGIELYRDRPNVCVLRTFSKAYGLAGLRVGFAIAHEPVAEALRKTAVPFGVSQLAQDAAVASLRAEAALLERVEALAAERSRVVAALVAQGWTPNETQANFVWLPLGERTVDFAAACAEAGVVVRPFPGDGVRVTIGETEGNDLFLETAALFRKES